MIRILRIVLYNSGINRNYVYKKDVEILMKIDRHIGIITTLQQNKIVTAPYLAEKFEVSRRTINRDIEDICKAGIPIVTTQGANGGISIMEGFSLDTTVFTEQELTAIFSGLKSIDSVSDSDTAKQLAKKIGGSTVTELAEHIEIDLSSFYKSALTEKIEIIKCAIRERKRIAFHYFYNKGEEDKVIEPYKIVFKWSDWYVFVYSTERNDFRMYKLRRLWNLSRCEEKYVIREIPEEKDKYGLHMTDDYFVEAIYESSLKFILVEQYGPSSFSAMDDGKLYTKWGFSSMDAAIQWFFQFGSKVKVISPIELVEKIKDEVESMKNIYES